MTKKLKSLMVFPTGQVACFDQKGEQVGELQENLLMRWLQDAIQKGYDPWSVVIEVDGRRGRFIKGEFGGETWYNLTFI